MNIENYTYEISHKILETKEDFIFTTVSSWLGSDTELSKIIISKQILNRALMCYTKEHAEEYHHLLDASYKRNEMFNDISDEDKGEVK